MEQTLENCYKKNQVAELEFKVSRNKRKIEGKTSLRKIPDNPGGLARKNGGNWAARWELGLMDDNKEGGLDREIRGDRAAKMRVEGGRP